jgi:hypothetical protein
MAKRLRAICALLESECSRAPDAAAPSARAHHSMRAVAVNHAEFLCTGLYPIAKAAVMP